MFLKTGTKSSTSDILKKIELLKEKIDTADAIIIGAGAGLSTSAGYTYSGKRFDKNFADFKAKYHFDDMYTGGFYPYKTLEEYWAYWSRYIYINRYLDPPKDTYEKLLKLVDSKDYFVITTNVDHAFQKAGFDKKRLFYTQGDYGLFQCSEPCCQKIYDNEEIIKQMVTEQKDMTIPTELIPYCPNCGAPMTMNLRADDKFVQDNGWYTAYERYQTFLKTRKGQNILFLELGVGNNTPVIIKYPFWKMTDENKNSTYACINLNYAAAPTYIQNRAICIKCDIDEVLNKL